MKEFAFVCNWFLGNRCQDRCTKVYWYVSSVVDSVITSAILSMLKSSNAEWRSNMVRSSATSSSTPVSILFQTLIRSVLASDRFSGRFLYLVTIYFSSVFAESLESPFCFLLSSLLWFHDTCWWALCIVLALYFLAIFLQICLFILPEFVSRLCN